MLNISKGVSLTLDAQGRILAEGLKKLPHSQADEIRQLIKNNRGAIVEYLKLWNKAWTLADFVEGNTAPYLERATKLPELNELVERMRTLENKLKAAPTKNTLPAGWIQAPVAFVRKKPWTPDNCPAKCKRTGKCYGETYFDHKPGIGIPCQGNACPWMK